VGVSAPETAGARFSSVVYRLPKSVQALREVEPGACGSEHLDVIVLAVIDDICREIPFVERDNDLRTGTHCGLERARRSDGGCRCRLWIWIWCCHWAEAGVEGITGPAIGAT
jgi:hypothetical protein